jgi:tRNA(Ile)-lysidine synthase
VSGTHVDHGLEASQTLSNAAAEIAGRLGIPFETIPVEVPPGPSLEAQAREARYAALSRVDGPVITGHTRDDALETMLINLVRGTGADGLGGIPYHRPPNVYRPILDVSRSETREIAALAELPFRDDPSNDDLRLTRNHIRRVVLPRLRDLNPRLDEAMSRAAAALRADGEYLDELADLAPSEALEVSLITTLPRPVADRLILRWLSSHEVRVSADLVERVWSVVLGETDNQDLEGGRSVVRDRALIRIE